MRKVLVITGAAAAALLAGCTAEVDASVTSEKKGGTPVRIAARLDCPQREGNLRLVSTAPDGRACAYRGEAGEEVELRLADLSTLTPLEAELSALIPDAAGPAAPIAPMPPLPPAAPGAPTPPAPVGSERVSVPGVMDVRSEGDRASVRLPGVSIEADGDNADVRIGGKDGEKVSVRARDGGAQIRVSDSKHASDVRSTFLVTSDKPGPAGWRVAGYQARSAGSGPAVIGVMRLRSDRKGDLMDDVEDLMDRNVTS